MAARCPELVPCCRVCRGLPQPGEGPLAGCLLCAASAGRGALCAGGPRSVFTGRAERGDPEQGWGVLWAVWPVHRLSLNGALSWGWR